MKVGIENLKKALIFALHIGNVVDDVTNHGTTMIEKLQGLMKLAPEFLFAAGIQFSALSAEVSDLDDTEKAELLAALKQEFNIADDRLELAIESGIGILLKFEGMVKEVSSIVQALKA